MKMIGEACALVEHAMRGKGKPCPCCWGGRRGGTNRKAQAKTRQEDRQRQRAREARAWRNERNED